MFWRSQYGRRNRRGADRVLVFIVAAVAAFLLFSGESQACPNRNDAKGVNGAFASLNRQPAARRVTIVSAAPTKDSERAAAVYCCGQCSDKAAASGHCPACAPALIASAPTLVLEELSQIYGCRGQCALKLIEPLSDFRPPRTLS